MPTTTTLPAPARPAFPSLRSRWPPRRRAVDRVEDAAYVRVVRWLTAVNFVAVVAVVLLICAVSERWWVGAALSYLPRLPWGVPAALLLLASARRAPWTALVNGAAILLVAGPVMGLSTPLETPKPAGDHAIRLISSNIQFGSASPKKLVLEMEQLKPDVVVLQEAHEGTDEFKKLFGAWNTIHVGEFWVSSKFPIRLVDEFSFAPFGRRTALLCELETPSGPVLVCNVHLNTPRYALSDLQWHSPLTGAGVDSVNEFLTLRREEARELREFVERHAAGRQFVLAGDFNTPAFSSTLVESWSGYTNAFEASGTGYGYTSPCNTRSYWPTNTPWVRIDHILVPAGWTVHSSGVGRTNGSDHRLIYSELTPDPV